ncbi:MAG: hypothetical protein V1926_04365 [Candidatus Peregrinibacteria bacterium]
MSHRTASVGVFSLLFLMYASVHTYAGWNANSRLDLLHALTKEGTLYTDRYHNNTGDKAFTSGHYYSDKVPGTVFLALPAFTIASAMLYVTHTSIDSETGWGFTDWFATAGSVGLLAALGGVAIFSLLTNLIGRRSALLVTLGTFLGSLPFPYATSLFSHAGTIGLLSIALWAVESPSGDPVVHEAHPRSLPLGEGVKVFMTVGLTLFSVWLVLPLPYRHSLFPLFVVCMLGGVVTFYGWHVVDWLLWHYAPLARLSSSGTSARDALAGFACGMALMSELTAGIAAIGIALLALLRGWPRFLRIALASVPPIMLFMTFNWLAFGKPWSVGYEHLLGWEEAKQGFFGIHFPPSPYSISILLFSEYRGLFFLTPLFLLSFASLWALPQRTPWRLMIWFLVPLVHVCFIGGFYLPSGGGALGPRYLSAIVPFLAVLSGIGMMQLKKTGTVLAVISIVLTGMGTFTNITPAEGNMFPFSTIFIPALLQGKIVPNLLSMLTGFGEQASLLLYALFLAGAGTILWVLMGKGEGVVTFTR